MNWQRHVVLQPDEIVLWEGRPVGWRASRAYLIHMLFGFPWAGVTYLLWTQPGGPRTVEYWVMLGIVGFVAVLCFTAPLLAWWLAGQTSYLLTNRRAVLVEPWLVKFGRVDSFRIPDWKLEVVRRRKGVGDIFFATFGMCGRLGFKHLADISVVEPLVRSLSEGTPSLAETRQGGRSSAG